MQHDDHSSRPRIASGLKQPTRGSQQLTLSSESHTGWASPPLLFGLAPRGVFRAPDVATRAVGSYPTFSPLPNEPSDSGEPQVLPRACRRSSSVTGGLFSVALSVAALQRCFRMPEMQPPGVTRRVALHLRSCNATSKACRSPDFPPARRAFAQRTGDHPAHPPLKLYAGNAERDNGLIASVRSHTPDLCSGVLN